MENVKTHPTYKNYGADTEGNIYNLKLNKLIKGSLNKMGQPIFYCGKSYLRSRFIYECFNGIIEKQYQIDHIDNDKTNNKLCNLQKLTPSENSLKKFSSDGQTNVGHRMRKVEAWAIDDKDNKKIFRSLSGAGKVTGVCGPSVQRVCDGIYFSATSKIDGKKYSFKYI